MKPEERQEMISRILGAGGTAFPADIVLEHGADIPHDRVVFSTTGMTLRDWFAGMTAAGLWATPSAFTIDENGQRRQMTTRDIAHLAYEQADELLAEKCKK